MSKEKKGLSLDDISDEWLESVTKRRAGKGHKKGGPRPGGALKKKVKASRAKRQVLNTHMSKMLEELDKEGY